MSDARAICAESDRSLTSATPARRSSTGCSRAATAARSCCASRTPTPSDRRAESERSILDDLRWLGLDWDEGPDVGGPYAPYRQSERLASIASRADRLLEAAQAYYCFCTAEALEAERQAALAAGLPPSTAGGAGSIPRRAAARAARGRAAAIRFRVPPGSRRDVPRRGARRRRVQHATSSAIRSSCGRTACRPTTSRSSSTTRRWRSRT